ncbi:MAG: TrkA C-terminal domain-containing protein [Pirellulaceae bacterium]|nr:TrkA C-terminal domain-containing protein [Pirellulaceae bacterium]
MAAIATLVVIAVVSLLAVRAGATALMMTGLSWDAANFQSYSAFFGVGFTTREAEMVVNHPVRRRIIRDLILVGNIGVTSAVATLVATMVQNSSGFRPLLIVVGLVAGLSILFYLTHVGWIQRSIDRLIQHTLNQTGLVRAMDYELLLRIQHGYVVSEIEILATMPLANRSLRQSRPWDHGVVVLAIKTEGKANEGIPSADTILREGDVATVYGEEHHIHRLFGDTLTSTSGLP